MVIDRAQVKELLRLYNIDLDDATFSKLFDFGFNLLCSIKDIYPKDITIQLKPLEKIKFGTKTITYSYTVPDMNAIDIRNNEVVALKETTVRFLINSAPSVSFTAKFAYWLYYLYSNVFERLQGIKQVSRNVSGISENTQYDINVFEKAKEFFKSDSFEFDCFLVVYRWDGTIEYV